MRSWWSFLAANLAISTGPHLDRFPKWVSELALYRGDGFSNTQRNSVCLPAEPIERGGNATPKSA